MRCGNSSRSALRIFEQFVSTTILNSRHDSSGGSYNGLGPAMSKDPECASRR
jgi:hypothetical protein